MSNTQHKRRDLRHKAPDTPSTFNPRGGAPLERWPFQQTLKAQDTLAMSARRMVASQTMSGQADSWLIPETDPGGQASQTHPKNDVDREVARYKFSLAPGCVMEMRSLYLPSGATQYNPSLWEDDGGFGAVKWALTWDGQDGDSDTSTHMLVQEPSQLQYNKQPAGFNGIWGWIRHGYQPFLIPTASWQQNAEWRKWSEYTTITAILYHRGSPRVIHTALTERPELHVDLHSNATGSSIHTYSEGKIHPDIRPQTEQDDGQAFSENRFGTQRGLYVADFQAERMGPALFSWSSFNEGTSGDGGNPGSVSATQPNPFSNATTTTKCIWDDSIQAWSAAAPGFAVAGHYALRFKENDPEQVLPGLAEATIPIRLRVYGRVASGTGYIMLQTSSRSALIWSFTHTTDQWFTLTGFVESQAHGSDSGTINGMVFGYADGLGGACEIHNCTVHYGEFAEN